MTQLWTKYNQDPVQVPHVMQESRWCPWYPKYRRWQVTHFMYYLSGSSSRGINTTNTEATIGHDPEPVLSTRFSHSLVSSTLSYHFPNSVLAGKFYRIQPPSSQLKGVSFHQILCRTSVFLTCNFLTWNLNLFVVCYPNHMSGSSRHIFHHTSSPRWICTNNSFFIQIRSNVNCYIVLVYLCYCHTAVGTLVASFGKANVYVTTMRTVVVIRLQ
jgi:hypothetical protein